MAPSGAIPSLFDHQAEFGGPAHLPELLAAVPGRWVVYLLLDGDDAPFQLLCVKNLRASLQRRLGTADELAPALAAGRKVPYSQITRRICWRRVDSALEADWVYAQAAAVLFPEVYRQFIESRRPWWIQIAPLAEHPRFTRTDQPEQEREVGGEVEVEVEGGRRVFGPLPTRAAAQRVIETLEDAFDLCRYHHILVQAPHGAACAYKQMHKCPAPCDGSIPLGLYREMIRRTVAFLDSPAELIAQQTQRMQSAAAALRFETAATIKVHLQQLTQLAELSLQPLEKLNLLAVLRGPRARQCKLWWITPQFMRPLICLSALGERGKGNKGAGLTAGGDELVDWLSQQMRHPNVPQPAPASAPAPPTASSAQAPGDCLALAAYAILHDSPDGILLPVKKLTAQSLAQAVEQIWKSPSRPRPAANGPATTSTSTSTSTSTEDDEGMVRQTH